MDTKHFIKARIEADVASGRTPKVVLRFPPEPNGYLHLGHVKSIVLNASMAEASGGELNLRFDDTNPRKESSEYVEAIERDARWLTDKFDRVLWTSNYFDTIHACAVLLINKGLAYVDDSSPEEMKAMRGDFGNAGVNSPCRDRSIVANLALFERMRRGDFADGERVLRARIDMAHPNLTMRDPALYRISHTEHHNTGKRWCLYPMYDFAHPIADAIEGITHSLCTLEFEEHRPLYDWVIEHCYDLLGARPTQIEFARMEAEGVVLSKRKLNALVTEAKVSGWDAPEMPTVSGLRARGYTASMLREFVTRCGFGRANSTVPLSVLNDCVCDELGPVVDRRMAVLDPVELVLSNLEDTIPVTVPNHPKDATRGSRPLTLTPSVWVERDDVRVAPEDGFWRLTPGNWVRLKHGLNVLVTSIETDVAGNAVRVHAEADLGSVDMKAAKHKAKAVIHWLSEEDSCVTPVLRYGNLFDDAGAFNKAAVTSLNARVESGLHTTTHYEFERVGYFWSDALGRLHHLADLKGTANKRKA
jgi:glutaminyl-tRNA synthetase